MLNEKGDYIAELCHIEAAEPGGPRFNPVQTDEERRSPQNLLFLCHRHHKETDNLATYTVERLREIKIKHEQLPAVVFNNELLVQKIEQILKEQARLSEHVKNQLPDSSKKSENYKIVGPFVHDAWTPDSGRFYESATTDGSKFKFMMRDGWMHIEHMLPDGATAYYELNEEGTVRNTNFPYPIEQYHVDIENNLILVREQLPSNVGSRKIKTTLKWSAGHVIEYFQGSMLTAVECKARCTVDHANRTIYVRSLPTSEEN